MLAMDSQKLRRRHIALDLATRGLGQLHPVVDGRNGDQAFDYAAHLIVVAVRDGINCAEYAKRWCDAYRAWADTEARLPEMPD